jgi:hypothetical protein
VEAIAYPVALLYWFAFSYMVFYFAGYAKNAMTYRIVASIAIGIIVTLLILDILWRGVR